MVKMMVVDDEYEISDFLRNFFTNKRFKVECSNSGEDAIQKLPIYKPQVLLLDICMPGLSGFDVLRQARKADKNLKIIMVSAVDDKNMIHLAKELGADDYITKPFSLDYLENNVLSKVIDLMHDAA
jgi:DNA-binding response OmpR family regulator